MKNFFLLNFIIPLTYLILYVLLIWQKLGHEARFFIAENSSALIIIQLIISAICIFIFQGRRLKFIVIVSYIIFFVFWYLTAGSFNPL